MIKDKIIKLKDDAYRVFINSECDLNNIKNQNLKSFIELVKDGFQTGTKSPLTDKILNEMDRVKRNEGWRTDYMTQKERDLDMIHKGELKGLQEGRSEIAKNLLEQNMDISFIVKVTGLTTKEVEALL